MNRSSGILLHISSLPSKYGIGDFGPEAYYFADFLEQAGQRIWQVLPLNAVNGGAGNSPYSGYSAFAGNPMFISPDLLFRDGIISRDLLQAYPVLPEDKIDFASLNPQKTQFLNQVFEQVKSSLYSDIIFKRFCEREVYWLEDYCLFIALKEYFQGLPWYAWPQEIKDRQPQAMAGWQSRLADKILKEKYFQFLFFDQWQRLKEYCNLKSIMIMGDMPIYVSHDSCDVWSNSKIFELDEDKKPLHVSGAPPDYFSSTGQLWGNPIYDWEKLKQTGYKWWVVRTRHNFKLYDFIRMDHFRGFAAFWQVPSGDKTAENGKWIIGPGADLFKAILSHIPLAPIVAEDLGIITAEVRELMNIFRFPGMKVLQFAFSADMPENLYISHNHEQNCIVYTGTHDNNTLIGWLENEVDQKMLYRINDYLGHNYSKQELPEALIRLAMSSIANKCIIPLQDILELGSEARINTPSKNSGNWQWRVKKQQLSQDIAHKMHHFSWLYGRL